MADTSLANPWIRISTEESGNLGLEIEADLPTPHFAVHEKEDYEEGDKLRWTVTHVPSGLALTHTTKEGPAVKVAQAAQHILADLAGQEDAKAMLLALRDRSPNGHAYLNDMAKQRRFIPLAAWSLSDRGSWMPHWRLAQMELGQLWAPATRIRNPAANGPTRAQAKALGRALREFADDWDIQDLARQSSVGVGSYTAGGCWALAKAFRTWAGTGELVALDVDKEIRSDGRDITSSHGPFPDDKHLHVLVKIGDRYFDALGVGTKRTVISRWTKQWTFPNMTVHPKLVPFDRKRAYRWIKCPYGLVESLLYRMDVKLGAPAQYGLPGKPTVNPSAEDKAYETALQNALTGQRIGPWVAERIQGSHDSVVLLRHAAARYASDGAPLNEVARFRVGSTPRAWSDAGDYVLLRHDVDGEGRLNKEGCIGPIVDLVWSGDLETDIATWRKLTAEYIECHTDPNRLPEAPPPEPQWVGREAADQMIASMPVVLPPVIVPPAFGSCIRCAVCLRMDVHRGCCTVCGDPLRPTKNPQGVELRSELRHRGRFWQHILHDPEDEEVGWLVMSREVPERLLSRCVSPIKAVQRERGLAPHVWVVDSSEVAEDLRGRGWGRRLYEAAARVAAADQALLVPDELRPNLHGDQTTSSAAKGVYASLVRDGVLENTGCGYLPVRR